MSILVTGASGFIGRRLAVALAVGRRKVLCTVWPDRDDPFYRGGREALRSMGVEPIECDLVTGRGCDGLGRANVVFHLAANTHTWEADHRCNDVGTENLVRALQTLGPNTHFIFTSTTAVMDDRDDLEKPMRAVSGLRRKFHAGRNGLLSPALSSRGGEGAAAHTNELAERSPISEYGRSKWRAEQFLRKEAAEQGFRLTILRLCTVYGPQPRPNTLFEVLKREVLRQSLAARLNWPARTSFVHVDDVVECLLRAAADPPEPGQTRIHLLAAESRTLAEVSQLLHLVSDIPYRPISLPGAAWRLVSNVRHVCRWGAGRIPARMFNALWRFNVIVNPVFDCDTTLMAKSFPGLKPRMLEDCIGDVMLEPPVETMASSPPEEERGPCAGARVAAVQSQRGEVRDVVAIEESKLL